ncbi:MAG: SMI1/KNR4 family protein, partial [Myxococcales bacterium]|nr:SMI1/KNR4 family protein [Myxococcales bacterium]
AAKKTAAKKTGAKETAAKKKTAAKKTAKSQTAKRQVIEVGWECLICGAHLEGCDAHEESRGRPCVACAPNDFVARVVVGDPARVEAMQEIVTRMRAMRSILAADSRVHIETGTHVARPLSDDEIGAWERRWGRALPEDYRAFLQLVGGFEFAWRFVERTEYNDVVGGRLQLGGLPRPHSLAADHDEPEYRDLFHIWEWTPEEGFLLRLSPRGASTLFWENANDAEVKPVRASFESTLRRWVEWWGIRPSFYADEAGSVPVVNGQRELGALYAALIGRGSVDPTQVQALLVAFEETDDDECPSVDRETLLRALAAHGREAAGAGPRIAAVLTEEARATPDSDRSELNFSDAVRVLRALGCEALAVEAARLRLARERQITKSKRPATEVLEEAAALLVTVARYGRAAEAAAARAHLLDLVQRPNYPHFSGGASDMLSLFEFLIEDPEGRRVLATFEPHELPYYKRGSDWVCPRIDRLLADAGIASPFRRWREWAMHSPLGALTGSALDRFLERYLPHLLDDRAQVKGVLAYLERNTLTEFARTVMPGSSIGWRSLRPQDRDQLVAWLDQVIAGIEAGTPAEALPVVWPDPEFVLEWSAPPRIPAYQAPERIERLRCDDPGSLKRLSAFTGLRALELTTRDELEPEADLAVIGGLANLEAVELNLLKRTYERVDFSFLSALTRLRELEVESDTLTREEGASLGAALTRLPRLESAKLTLGSEALGASVSALARRVPPTLRLLRLERGALDRAAMDALTEGAFAGVRSLYVERGSAARLRAAFGAWVLGA